MLFCVPHPLQDGLSLLAGHAKELIGIAVNIAVNTDRAARTRDGQTAVIPSLCVRIGIFDDARLQHIAICRVKRKRGVRVIGFDPEDVTVANFPFDADCRVTGQGTGDNLHREELYAIYIDACGFVFTARHAQTIERIDAAMLKNLTASSFLPSTGVPEKD